MPDISKINLNGTSYTIKDANAVKKQVAPTDEIKAYCATDNDTTLVSVAQGQWSGGSQIMMTDADGVFRRPLYPGGVSGLGDDGLPNVSEVQGIVDNAGYIYKTDNEGVYVNEGIGDNRVVNIPLDQNVEAAVQIVTKDPDYQIKKPSYSSGIEGLSDTNILNKKETNTLITSKNYATQTYVQEQLNTVKPQINVVYGNALPTQAQMYQYCVQYNNGTALLRYKPSSGSDLLIPLCTLSLLGSGSYVVVFEYTLVSGSKMTKRCYIVSGSISGGSAVVKLNQTEWIFK